MLEWVTGDACRSSIPTGREEQIDAREEQALRGLNRADRLAMEACDPMPRGIDWSGKRVLALLR